VWLCVTADDVTGGVDTGRSGTGLVAAFLSFTSFQGTRLGFLFKTFSWACLL